MAGERTFLVKILGNADGAITAFKNLGRQADRALGGLDKVGNLLQSGFQIAAKAAAVGAAAVGAIGAAAFVAIQKASDLNETLSKVRVTFGDTATQIDEFAKTAATSLGQTRQQALDAAATFGMFGKSAGLTGTALGDFSIKFTQLASDLASFNNTTPEDAIVALGAALRGESEPIRRYGVLLNDAALKQIAMEMGIYSGNGALTAQQKVLAASEAIFRQTTDAQGDFSRTSDGLANQQRILRAQLEDISATLGQLVLPYFLQFVRFINERILPAVKIFADNIGEKGVGNAFKLAIASMGDFGLKAINAFEVAITAVLKFTGTLINAVQTTGLFTAALAAISGNVVTFGKSAALVLALDVAEGKLAETTKTLPGYFANLRREVLNLQSTMPVAVTRIIGTADALERMATKTKGAGTDLTGLDEILNTASKSTGKAKDVLKEYTQALDKVASAEKSVASAQKSRVSASKSLQEADVDVMKAQKALKDALEGFGAESAQAKDAQRELSKAQRELERSGYRVEQAVFAVSDAEKELNEAREDGDKQKIREAEIRLAEAKLAVADATDNQLETTKQLSDAQSKLNEIVNGAVEGSKTYKTLLEALDEAKEKQTSAQERYNDAVDRELETIKNLKKEYIDLKGAAAGAGKGFVMPALPTIPTPTTGNGTNNGTSTIVNNIYPGVGTNGAEAGRQIAELLQQYQNLNPNGSMADFYRQAQVGVLR